MGITREFFVRRGPFVEREKSFNFDSRPLPDDCQVLPSTPVHRSRLSVLLRDLRRRRPKGQSRSTQGVGAPGRSGALNRPSIFRGNPRPQRPPKPSEDTMQNPARDPTKKAENPEKAAGRSAPKPEGFPSRAEPVLDRWETASVRRTPNRKSGSSPGYAGGKLRPPAGAGTEGPSRTSGAGTPNRTTNRNGETLRRAVDQIRSSRRQISHREGNPPERRRLTG